MKTLVRKDGNISIYLFADDVTIVVGNSSTQVSGTIPLIITDCDQNNTFLFENVTPPDDWNFHKYLYEADTWTLNPNWIDPTQPTA